jgi:hypothetical protein
MAIQKAPDKLLPWPRGQGAPEVSGPRGPRDSVSADTPPGHPHGSPASTPAGASERAPESFPPLTFVTIGQSALVDRPDMERRAWLPEDFARLFLGWVAHEYPHVGGRHINVVDIELDLLPRFQVATICPNLGLGTLLRGLGKVTKKRERQYANHTGARCTVTEYLVPRRRRA